MTRKLLLDDLARSGLTKSVADKMKLKPLSGDQTEALGHFNAPSYRIPYFDINGKVVKDYYRVRYLETPRGEFGRELPKPPRYSGPTGVAPAPYFSPVVSWKNPVATDVSVPLWITEGEKKATAACLAGVYCVGLGGVAMFQSRKRGIDFLPEFDAFEWDGREVVIAFDSDKDTNANIIREQNTLAQRLLERNAHVLICDIPETVEGEKAGLDDFLAHFKTKAERETALAWLAVDQTEEYAQSAVLWQLQDELAVIRKRGAVYVFEQNALSNNYNKLAKLDYGDREYWEPPTSEDGKPKKVKAIDAWLAWPQRRSYSDIVYAPGKDEIVDDDLNVWPGWGVEPKKGDIRLFVKLVEFLFTNEPDLLPWFWQWLAYPIQNPGTKMYSAVVLHGPHQGTGKTFLGEIMGDIYGENFSLLAQDDLTGQFNDAFARKQFALADEIIGAQDRKQADKLKGVITRQTVAINKKWESAYRLRDTINYLFTSNHFDAVYLERGDRRYAVVAVPDEALSDDYYDKLRAWRKAGGPAALFHHLLGVDCSSFGPLRRPPESGSHIEMIQSGFSDLDAWAEDLKNAPDAILQINGVISDRELFRPQELLHIYDPGGRRGTTVRALGLALKKARFPQKTAKLKRYGGALRLYAARRPDVWRKRGSGEWADEYEKHNPHDRREKMT